VHVELLLTDQAAMPASSAPWSGYELPYRLLADKPDTAYAWFRFDLPRMQGDAPLSLYLSNYMYSVEVYLNGVRIGGTSEPPDTLALGWTHPLLLSLPAGLLQAGNNLVHLRLTQAAFTNVLPELVIGPETELLPVWQRKLFTQSQVALVSLVLCVLMGLFTLGLWVQRPRDLEFACFAGASMFMALPMFYLSASYAVLPHAVMLPGAMAGIFLAAGCFLMFLGRTLHLQQPGWEKALMLAMVSASLLLPVLAVAHVRILLLGVYTLWFIGLAVVLRQAMTKIWAKSTIAWWVIAPLVLLAIVGGHDFYIFVTSDFADLNRHGLYLQYAIPLMLIIYFAQLVQRYITALHDSEVLGEQLELRVAIVSAELEDSYRTRRLLELEEAAEQQRQKIYQDLHDDVGARLLAIVHTGESHKQSSMAQSALASLRDTVATSYVEALTIPLLIDKIGEELAVRCRSHDLDFELVVADSLPDATWNSEVNHHAWRILQEVVNNSICHARASLVILTVVPRGLWLEFRISDKGSGFPAQLRPGSGMRNIRYRANQLNASVQWSANPEGGTDFVLQVPVVPVT